jgi:16S rRNA (adenine1518-N6/adenine1519-N6)-dimethyltransferase
MNAPAASHQTVSYLVKRFAEAGVEVKPRHGQNFLIDLNLLGILVDTAELTPGDVVLEVGTGTGALTGLLVQRAAFVVSVEIDPQMHQLASEELFGVPNVLLLQQDALHSKSSLSPAIVEAVKGELESHPGSRLKLVANLPYNVATPIISNLLASEICPRSMTVTIQKELADRMTARPSTKNYSALSVWIQSQCRAQLIRTLPPTVFWPRPRVTSAILQVDVDPELRNRIADPEYFHDFVRQLFCHRRKFLRGVLASLCKDRLTKADVDALLSPLHLNADVRAEQLDVATLLTLSDAVQAATGAE